jgi:hypothetical protein
VITPNVSGTPGDNDWTDCHRPAAGGRPDHHRAPAGPAQHHRADHHHGRAAHDHHRADHHHGAGADHDHRRPGCDHDHGREQRAGDAGEPGGVNCRTRKPSLIGKSASSRQPSDEFDKAIDDFRQSFLA